MELKSQGQGHRNEYTVLFPQTEAASVWSSCARKHFCQMTSVAATDAAWRHAIAPNVGQTDARND